ncbi:MAG: hypothetical protein OCD00_17340 [Colwellia sp.]
MKTSRRFTSLITLLLLASCSHVNFSALEQKSAPEQEPSLVKTKISTPSIDLSVDITSNDNVLAVDKKAACDLLVNDASVNWRESGLTSDQEIIECLATSLGKPVGFGENTTGGYDVNGSSELVIINKQTEKTVEQQIHDAVSSDKYRWIVFDKNDFANTVDIAMYRLKCNRAKILTALGNSTVAECLDHRTWCENNSIDQASCESEFFNKRLNDKSLPVRNVKIRSNTTIDGRMSKVNFRFSGFSIDKDKRGGTVKISNNVIVTHVSFLGAGHTEDHQLDPDMVRTTDESYNVWIHKNTFDLTGDSAFDVKMGAHNITMSFNKIYDVKRSSLQGASDGRAINSQIATTMHHNAFITRGDKYFTFGNTARRVPLMRRGTAHVSNNVFINYRKQVFSLRVGANLQFDNNVMAINRKFQEKDSLDASLNELTKRIFQVKSGTLNPKGTALWFSDDNCQLQAATKRDLSYQGILSGESEGSMSDLVSRYNHNSQAMITRYFQAAGQELVNYVLAVAGNNATKPFNAPSASIEKNVTLFSECR